MVREVLIRPAGFFRGLERRDSLWNPVVFAMACLLITAPLSALAESVDPLAGAGQAPGFRELLSGLTGGNVLAAVVLVLVFFLVILPLFALVGLYIGAGIYQLLIRLFVGRDNAGFENTLRLYAYSSGSVALLSWVPVLGILASFYGVYLAFMGIREVHGANTTRAVLVVLLPFILLLASWLVPVFVSPGG